MYHPLVTMTVCMKLDSPSPKYSVFILFTKFINIIFDLGKQKVMHSFHNEFVYYVWQYIHKYFCLYLIDEVYQIGVTWYLDIWPWKNTCLWNTNAPFVSRIGLTFDLDLSPTDLNIDRGHLLIKNYLPTKFEASWAKHSWVISCTRCGRPTWLWPYYQ